MRFTSMVTPRCSGMTPPHTPPPPPNGTSGMRDSAQAFTSAESSAVVSGHTTTSGALGKRPCLVHSSVLGQQSRPYKARVTLA